jgi:hypothetical protein
MAADQEDEGNGENMVADQEVQGISIPLAWFCFSTLLLVSVIA